jgi:hypothetical protein
VKDLARDNVGAARFIIAGAAGDPPLLTCAPAQVNIRFGGPMTSPKQGRAIARADNFTQEARQ